MITVRRIIEIDDIRLYVRVIVNEREIKIIWDRCIPTSTVRRLLCIVFSSIIPSIFPASSRSRNTVICKLKFHDLECEQGGKVILNCNCNKNKIRA